VTGALADTWIDYLRAAMVLSRAGARTPPMDTGQVSIARVTADPTVSWHGESVALPDTAPTFGKVTLNAKTAVCLVRLSLELAQDSANIESQLQGVMTNAMAGAIDSAGLNGARWHFQCARHQRHFNGRRADLLGFRRGRRSTS